LVRVGVGSAVAAAVTGPPGPVTGYAPEGNAFLQVRGVRAWPGRPTGATPGPRRSRGDVHRFGRMTATISPAARCHRLREEPSVGGTRNQARVAAQLRLRRHVDEHDRLLAAYYRAADTATRAQRRVDGSRGEYESRLANAEAACNAALRERAEALVAVARELGDDRAADVLQLPLSRVRGARRHARGSTAGPGAPPTWSASLPHRASDTSPRSRRRAAGDDQSSPRRREEVDSRLSPNADALSGSDAL
jgi:hypothetical protein